MSNLVPALLIVILLVGGYELLFRFRTAAMRNLAMRSGFRFATGSSGLWGLWFAPKASRPTPTFPLVGDPLNGVSRTWNVIEGEKNGLSIPIFDSILDLGIKSGTYRTYIAARCDTNPFGTECHREKIIHRNGWTILCRFQFLQILPGH